MNPQNAPTNLNGGVVPSTPAAASPSAGWYTSNPFLISVKGLVLVLQSNPVPVLLTGLIFVVALIAYAIVFGILGAVLGDSSGGLIVTLLSFVVLLVLSAVSIGAYLAIAGASAKNERISTGDAFGRAFGKTLPFVGLMILMSILIGFGYLLLLIPGIILMARTSLAVVAMFEEDLGPVAALKRSFALTKGHTFEMLGAIFAGSLLGSAGLLAPALGISPLVGRYNELKQLQASGEATPKMHWLNWGLPLLLVLAGVAYFIFVATLISSVEKGIKTTPSRSNPDTFQFDSEFESEFRRQLEEDSGSDYNFE